MSIHITDAAGKRVKVSSGGVTIQSGGGGGSPGTPPDPVQVYNSTRPADWLPMPEPQDNEMYLLFHIPDGVSSLLAFTVTCTDNYTVSLGTVSDGAFAQSSSVSLASGAKYEAELMADDYSNLTSDGMKQVMIKISGMDILKWGPATHSKKTAPSTFCDWNIVEIVCKLPSATNVACGNSTGNRALRKLRYFSALGTSNVISTSGMFYNCYSLSVIPQLDTSKVTSMRYMFYSCYSLSVIPQLDTSKVTDMSYMFRGCQSLAAIPQLDTSRVTNMSQSFSGCGSLLSIPQLDTSRVTNMSGMFSYSYSFLSIPQLDTSRVTNMSDSFSGCDSLSSILFRPDVTGWAGYAIILSNRSLGHQALVNLLNSLPTITSSKALTLTGNPGVSELTEEEKAIATGKNWTLTL